ncbi:hypothetical protein ABZ866_02590 [Streptomyces erythrochromogenes]
MRRCLPWRHPPAAALRHGAAPPGRRCRSPPSGPWQDSDGSDQWESGDETRDQLIAFYRRTWERSDATIAELALDGRSGMCSEQEGRIDREARAAHWARIEQAARSAAPLTAQAQAQAQA